MGSAVLVITAAAAGRRSGKEGGERQSENDEASHAAILAYRGRRRALLAQHDSIAVALVGLGLREVHP